MLVQPSSASLQETDVPHFLISQSKSRKKFAFQIEIFLFQTKTWFGINEVGYNGFFSGFTQFFLVSRFPFGFLVFVGFAFLSVSFFELFKT
jgi:hypothetical protein